MIKKRCIFIYKCLYSEQIKFSKLKFIFYVIYTIKEDLQCFEFKVLSYSNVTL